MPIKFPKINRNLRISGPQTDSLETKLKNAVRHRELSSLKSKITPIIRAIDEKSDALKKRGGITQKEQREVLQRIGQIARTQGESFSKREMRVINKEILNPISKKNLRSMDSVKTPKKSFVEQKEEDLQKKKSILSSIFGKQKEEKKPIKREIIRAGRIDFKTGNYEDDFLNRAGTLSISAQAKKGNTIGLGGKLEKDGQSSVSALSDNKGAIGIGGQNKSTGFSTINNITNKK